LTYAGKGRFVTQPLDLNDLVRDMRPEIESLLGTQVELRFDLARGVQAILADPIQIRQVVLNLVNNSAEAIGDRPGTLTIKTRMCTLTVDQLARYQLGGELPAGEYIELTVADTGGGISPATQARMFDPFFSTKVAGRGLGLATVLGVVQGHNGALRVSSSPGQGTHLIMLLPSSPIPAISPAGDVVSPGLVRLYGTVLVVDDEEAVRTTAARILERLGYNVLTANDGMMGVEVFQKHIDTITCVLLDLTMPRMNGVEAVAAIRQIKPDACIVLMSGYNEHDITSRFGGLGVSGFLQKPFTPNQLHTRIQQACAV
jgi:CheY-like chemotaxis protein